MKLERLLCSCPGISDLEPLREMPLRNLSVASTQVTDLHVLAGLPLETLSLHGLNITSLDPLRALHLRDLDMSGAKGDVDMAKLSGCSTLEAMVFPREAAHIASLRALPKLVRLRVDGIQPIQMSAEDFWAAYKPAMEAVGDARLTLAKAGLANANIYQQPDGTLRRIWALTNVESLAFTARAADFRS